MNKEKLSSDQVPQKFAEWLLSMGCPQDKVPTVDKLAEMCRGQYYMVWRSLMEHVEPKDAIRSKRLQVFVNDMQRCQKNNAFSKADSSIVVPEELALWRQQKALREKVKDAEARVLEARQGLNQLVDKVSSRLSQRNLARERVHAAQRRAWLLQQLAEELRAKKDNLGEAKNIADSLATVEDCSDIESKLDKVTSRPQNNRAALSVTVAPLASSSIASNNTELNDSEEQLSSLVKCGASLWPQLCERRASLVTSLSAATVQDTTENKRVTPQWVLAHTSAMHCSLALNAMKNKLHIKHTQNKLAETLAQLNLSGASCELAVLLAARACSGARAASLRALHGHVTSRAGLFDAPEHQLPASGARGHIAALDKAIISKREELKRLITSLAITDRKILNVRECLINVFNNFHADTGFNDHERFPGQLSLPSESVGALRRFYEEWRERCRNRVNLSMDLDTSDNCSYNSENAIPTFIDELKIYMKNFCLEHNRKLVLDSGEKIWIFETLQSSIERLHSSWQRDDVTSSLLCPSVSLSKNLERLILLMKKKEDAAAFLKELECNQTKGLAIDISAEIDEEQNTIDKIKKKLNENIIGLQKSTKTLDLGMENLQLWSDNSLKKHISCNRTVDGKTYKEYEAYYIENLNM
ncbi:uncharacterized protein LOC110381631 [Helicoverpa armigera]|uniref:uncharacterized protein LOC110381631 n=1 Tax=Helicoverpa armigera TaxID=29058 RepID=UPI003082D7B6